MSANQPPTDSQTPEPTPAVVELDALRAEMQTLKAPEAVRRRLLETFEAQHQSRNHTPQPVSPSQASHPWLALAACATAAVAVGLFWLNAMPTQTEMPRQTETATQTKVSPVIAETRGTTPGAIRQTNTRLSPAGPLYTGIKVPVQTHSLTNGPGLRYVSTLTYQRQNHLNRALFVTTQAGQFR